MAAIPQTDPKLALDQALASSIGSPELRRESEDGYRVRIPVFEGPLDLLLHLIRKEQINIYDIPVARICQSYLEHLELLREPDVDLAAEFMVMAATLIHLKSLMLLPNENAEEGADPRTPLVQQLLEHERFKKAAEQIDSVPWLYRELYPRHLAAIQSTMPVESLMDVPIEPVETFQLLLCLKVALNRTTRPPLQISMDPTSIRDKVTELSALLDAEPIIDFRKFMPAEPQVRDVILAFLAMLELARLKFVEILQHEAFGPIQIRTVKPLRDLHPGMLNQY